MKTLITIPARFASTRYPGKPLVGLKGATGEEKTLIQRSWEAACGSKYADRVVVATDDERIADASAAFGAEVVMTSSKCTNGTERCAEVVQAMSDDFDIVVNLQGDAPLTPPWFVDDLVEGLSAAPDMMAATPVLRCDAHALNGFLEDRRAGRVGGTTAVFGHNKQALYFSKEVIPYTGRPYGADDQTPVFHHVGVYAYRPAALKSYMSWSEGPLEALEGLEQLRFLENGCPLLCVEVDGKGRAFWELNNPEDVARIEGILKELGQE
ncbi:MAG: 3-deoxy-manno-octulosonate cytidylyltransferase [Planktomarina sp.]